MSQKRINNIKASSVKTDPISTPIVRKEKEPNIQIEQKWVPFFQDSDNVYVNDLAKRARRSSTHSSIINLIYCTIIQFVNIHNNLMWTPLFNK